MKTGFRGAFVIAWSQTEVDGLGDAPGEALVRGAAWSWNGDILRVDGPSNVLQLDRSAGRRLMRQRAAHMVTRLVGAALKADATVLFEDEDEDDDYPLAEHGFVITDGAQSFVATLISAGTSGQKLLLFVDEIPPRDTDLWVVATDIPREASQPVQTDGEGIICFTPGTRIDTPDGPRLIEHLRIGDRVLTRDNGPQEILWSGSRRMSGARLFAMPKLRPIRIRMGALGIEVPDQELLVSPDHRMLVQGQAAQDLFNETEVLVAARHLVDGDKIVVDTNLREATYVHLLFERHEVLTANGVASESFHPASADLSTLDGGDRERLMELMPKLAQDRESYGAHARRILRASEAAILRHAA